MAQYLLTHESMDGDQFAAAMEDGATVEQLEAIAAEKAEQSRRENEERAKAEAERKNTDPDFDPSGDQTSASDGKTASGEDYDPFA